MTDEEESKEVLRVHEEYRKSAVEAMKRVKAREFERICSLSMREWMRENVSEGKPDE